MHNYITKVFSQFESLPRKLFNDIIYIVYAQTTQINANSGLCVCVCVCLNEQCLKTGSR